MTPVVVVMTTYDAVGGVKVHIIGEFGFQYLDVTFWNDFQRCLDMLSVLFWKDHTYSLPKWSLGKIYHLSFKPLFPMELYVVAERSPVKPWITMMPTLRHWCTTHVVIMTTCGAASDDKVGFLTAFCFQCFRSHFSVKHVHKVTVRDNNWHTLY